MTRISNRFHLLDKPTAVSPTHLNLLSIYYYIHLLWSPYCMSGSAELKPNLQCNQDPPSLQQEQTNTKSMAAALLPLFACPSQPTCRAKIIHVRRIVLIVSWKHFKLLEKIIDICKLMETRFGLGHKSVHWFLIACLFTFTLKYYYSGRSLRYGNKC